MAPSNFALRRHSTILVRSTSLSSGAKAGVAIGCIFGTAVLLCVSWPFIARLWRRRRGKVEEQYHPSQDDPTHNHLEVPQRTDTDRRLSLPGAEDKPDISPDSAYDPQKPGSEVPPLKSSFDPNYPVPPHYRDHPDYLAYQAAQRAAAAAAAPSGSTSAVPQPTYQGSGATPGQVSIQPTSSRFGQLKDNAKNKLAWSADKAQFIKKAFHDKKKDTHPTPANQRSFYGDEFDSPNTDKPSSWFPLFFHSQDAGPSARPHTSISGPQAGQSQHPSQLLSPAPSGLSPPVSPESHVLETFDQPEHQYSTLLSGGKSGLPSPPLIDQKGFDPKHLWHPTNPSERQHRVNQELDTLQTSPVVLPESAIPASPSNPLHEASPTPELDRFQPSPDPSLHIEPATPAPQTAATPQTHDTEMIDVVSDFSTPHDRLFSAMSNHDTPESHFTDSDALAASPGSNRDSDMGLGSPAPFASDRIGAEVSDAASPAEALSAASPEDPASASSPKSYTCDECGKTFEQIHRLNHHRRYHDRKHECTVAGCNKKFGTKTHLDRHINDKHKKTRKFYCIVSGCQYSIEGGKSFPRKDNWVRHMRKKHRNLSVNQLQPHGLLVDEETGVAQSVAAPPGQNHHTQNTTAYQQNMDMTYGGPLGVPTSLGSIPTTLNGSSAGYLQQGMSGYQMSNGMMGTMSGMQQHTGMHNGGAMGMNGGGMSTHINIQQPPMPPGAGFNSPWNMG